MGLMKNCHHHHLAHQSPNPATPALVPEIDKYSAHLTGTKKRQVCKQFVYEAHQLKVVY